MFFREVVGDSPRKVRGVGESTKQKVGRLWFWGQIAREFPGQIDGEKVETVRDFMFCWAPKSLQMATAAMKLKDTCSLAEKL